MMLEERARHAAAGIHRSVELMPARAVAAAPGSYQSFIRFAERRRRTERVTAIVVALILVVAAFGAAIGLLRGTVHQQPADTVITPEDVGDLELEWSVSTGDPDAMYSPAVAGDLVLVTTKSGELLAYPVDCTDPCEPVWHAETGRPLSRIAVQGGVAYVAERATGEPGALLYAFSTDCASGGASCEPAWTGEIGAGVKWNSMPLLAGGRVIVAAADRVSAFAVGCGAEGARCEPVWVAHPRGIAATAGSGITASTATEDAVYVASPKVLAAYPVGCEGACAPSWTRSAPQLSQWLAVWGDTLLMGSMERASAPGAEPNHVWAFPTACASVTDCDVLWSIETQGITPVGVAGDVMYVIDTIGDLVAYEEPCGEDGCRERWRVPKPVAQEITAEPALVVDGVVYISSANGYVFAYPVDCEPDCRPIWQTTEGGWGYTYVAVGAGKVFAGSDGIYAFGLPAGTESAASVGWPSSSVPVIPIGVAIFAAAWFLVRFRNRRLLTR